MPGEFMLNIVVFDPSVDTECKQAMWSLFLLQHLRLIETWKGSYFRIDMWYYDEDEEIELYM